MLNCFKHFFNSSSASVESGDIDGVLLGEMSCDGKEHGAQVSEAGLKDERFFMSVARI